jgi:hypothetical protein
LSLPLLPAVAGHWERQPTREELTTMPYDPKDIPATLDVRNAEVRLYHMWAESLVGVATNDTQRHALILSSEPAWPPGALNRRKYVIYNTREGMTHPGQWYLDRTAGRLVYWPRAGEDMAKMKIIAPTTERVISLAGKRDKPVQRITLRGLSVQVTIVLFRRQPKRLSPGEERSCQGFASVGRMTSFKARRYFPSGSPFVGAM